MNIPNIDLSRLSEMFRPSGMNPMNMNQPMNQPMDNGLDLDQAMMNLLTPKDAQYDRFTQLLQSIPRRENFQPTIGRRIAAALAGLGNVSPAAYVNGQAVGFKSDIPGSLKIQQGILDEPYNRALYDWKIQSDPTLEAAKLENTRNVNSRIAGSNLKSAQLRERGIQETENRNRTLARQRDEEIEIKRQNAAAADYKAKNPNKQFKDANGFLVALDPATGNGEIVKDTDGNPIETGKLSDEAKLSLQLTNAKEMENLRFGHNVGLEEIRQGNRESLENTRQGNRERSILTRANNPSRTTQKDETAANRQTRLFNRALEGLNKNRAWKDYISIDAVRKIFKVDTPQSKSGLFGTNVGAKKGGDPKVADEIIKYIYGDEKPPEVKEPPKAPKGWKYVAKPGGGWTAVEDK